MLKEVFGHLTCSSANVVRAEWFCLLWTGHFSVNRVIQMYSLVSRGNRRTIAGGQNDIVSGVTGATIARADELYRTRKCRSVECGSIDGNDDDGGGETF